MKLDKRACLHAANVPLHISQNAGVLYTDRVKYLVTAAVKLLGGHRVLAVYFYECERLKANDRMPKWVVFQGKDDFATLERDAAGKRQVAGCYGAAPNRLLHGRFFAILRVL